MPNYVAGKDYKSRTERMFNPSESESMSKKTVVKKVIDKLHGSHRRIKLEKAFRKLSIEETIMIGMLVDSAIQKELDAVQNELNSKCKDTI